MAITFLVIDETGEAGRRRARLEKRIQERGLARPGASSAQESSTIVLCHSEDLHKHLPSLSNNGDLLVVYSGGRFESWEEGGILYRALADVERVLGWAQQDWNLQDVIAVLAPEWMTIRQQGFSALAILAQCAGSKRDLSAAAKRRREIWQREPKKWAEVLKEIGLSALQECARRERMPEAERLLAWILGGADAPNFLLAAEEAAALA